MQTITFVANDLSDTQRLGAALADLLPAGTAVALEGTLGAGKTRLVQEIATHLGVPAEAVVSPTFVLCQQYQGQRTIYHLDAYRLADEDELLALGVEEYFYADGDGDGNGDNNSLVFIEWADRVAGCLPPERMEIRLEVTGDTSRKATITGWGLRYEEVVTQLAQRLGA